MPDTNSTISALLVPTGHAAAWIATNDNEYDPVGNAGAAVAVEKVAATLTEPRKAIVWAKTQAVNYQYIHAANSMPTVRWMPVPVWMVCCGRKRKLPEKLGLQCSLSLLNTLYRPGQDLSLSPGRGALEEVSVYGIRVKEIARTTGQHGIDPKTRKYFR